MRYYIIAGEASGDLHGSNLIKALKAKDNAAEIRAWGGDLMEAAGAEIVKHYRDLAFMGFVEVLMNIRTIARNLKFCKQDIEAFQPDVVIFIDYPGFNLRIAEWAHQKNYKTFYYISPQVWAWKQSRVHKIKKVIDQMYVILPFEKAFYDKFDYEVNFVGHPLLDAIAQFNADFDADRFRSKHQLDGEKPVIALLPGSRKQEIKIKLPIMLSVVDAFPDYQFVIAGAPSQDREFYAPFLTNDAVKLVENDTYGLLRLSKAALVTSGTATLETALFEVPEVICYKGSAISYQIAKRIINVKYIGLVNLIMDKEVVRELIQKDLNTANLKTELSAILEGQQRDRILKDYQQLKQLLGGEGASEACAAAMLQYLRD